ncbi:MAG: hypothetical protein M1422_02155 [Candidatus Thermoplasmatota archaeon]|nr:hypothetical protein [Candidatus Thermoplasmatota archaeon]MCL5253104.1 hypothetical protein [Candidatus Thermoplasmatota archaeon]
MEYTGILKEGAVADVITVRERAERNPSMLAPENVESVIRHGKLIKDHFRTFGAIDS